jgi:TetR/AcrR family transcriptional regulator, fatty acid metabolism regulator protein
MVVHIGGRMKRTRKSGDERRDQIARAALAIVDEQGTGALSVASVAHRVGVAPSALYRHFPDKDAIVEDMIARLGTTVRANLQQAVVEGETDAVAALAGLLTRHVEFVLANRGFPLLVFSDLIQQHPERRARMRDTLEQFRGVIASLLRRGREQGRVRADADPEAGSFAFLGLFIPPGLFWHLSGGRTDLAGVVRRAWSIYLAGIRAPRVPARRPTARAPRRAQPREKRP